MLSAKIYCEIFLFDFVAALFLLLGVLNMKFKILFFYKTDGNKPVKNIYLHQTTVHFAGQWYWPCRRYELSLLWLIHMYIKTIMQSRKIRGPTTSPLHSLRHEQKLKGKSQLLVQA